MKKYEFILVIFFFLSFAQLYAEERYLELGASYSFYNKIHTLHSFDTADLVLENGETVEYSEYSDSSKKYQDYDFDYGDKSRSVLPSFGVCGRVGFYFKERDAKNPFDLNLGIGLSGNIGYENNNNDWKAYKTDFGPEITASNGYIGIAFKTNLAFRVISSEDAIVESYHVDDSKKEIYPVYKDVVNDRCVGFGMGLMLYTTKISYINTRLYCDIGFNYLFDRESEYIDILETYMRIGLLYAIW